MLNMYLYYESSEDCSLGNERMILFEDKNDAENYLKEKVEKYFGESWDDLNPDDFYCLKEDRVEYYDGDIVFLWNIEALTPVKKKCI